MASLWAFLRLSRPHFLVGGALMFAVGAASADDINGAGYALGQLMVTAAQVTAHYLNEYADVEADRLITHRTLFSGGSGVLPRGELDTTVALRAAWISTGGTVAASVALATQSLPAASIAIPALAVAWLYSLPPARLVGSGWGELATSLLVAGAVPMVGLLSQGSPPTASLWWSMAILVPIHFAMMLVFELPDLETDAAAGKRVVAVRIGAALTTRLILVLQVSAVVVAAVGGWIEALSNDVAWWTAASIAPGVATVAAKDHVPSGLMTASAVATLVLAAVGLLVWLNG